jgi:phosphoribosylformylglycinamidine cyclo-ligase
MSENKPQLSYRDAGVNIDAANEALSAAKADIKKTFNDSVLQDIGSFGAMYSLDLKGIEEPVLVSSVDGVGTKLKLAFMTGKHNTVGIDLVSHCVNDILVQGARPLFFLDYIAVGKLEPPVVAEVIRGLSRGCMLAGCALIGGETAEMPDMYPHGEYDLAGTIVGIVDRKKIVDGSTIDAGDAIIGLPSSGLHTNGYSLARKICFDVAGLKHDDPMPGCHGTVAEILMEPHVSYAKLMQIVMRVVNVRGMAHITGGGITDNFPRILSKGLAAEVDLGAWPTLPVFKFLQEAGNVATLEMLRTFNMGLGFMFVVPQAEAAKALETIDLAGQKGWVVGKITEGDGSVSYTGAINHG